MRDRLPAILCVLLVCTVSTFAMAGSGGVFAGVLQALGEHTGNSDYHTQVARSLVPGQKGVLQFGRNGDIDMGSTPEDVWEGSGIYVPPTVAMIHSMVSTSTDDAAAGTGARTVRIEGLDTSFLEITEDLTLNGTTAVSTTLAYRRINFVRVETAGSGQVNAGDITLTMQNAPVTVTAHLETGRGQLTQAIYTVPAGTTGYMGRLYAIVNKSGVAASTASVTLFGRTGIDGSEPAIRNKFTAGLSRDGAGYISHDLTPPMVLDGPCDLFFRVEEVSANDTSVDAGFDIVLVED